MFALTQGAAEAIKHVVSSAQIPEQGGVRISARPVDSQTVSLDLSLVVSPEPGDAIVEDKSANVFVDQELAPYLDDKVLDATIEADQVAFTIVEQRQDWSGNGQPENIDPRSIS